MDSHNGSATLFQPSGFNGGEIRGPVDKKSVTTDDINRTSKDVKRLREELLIARVALREKRECLADYRAMTTDALAKAVDFMRRNLSSDVPSIPKQSLSDILEFLQSCHEQHSSAVNDYEEAETDYSEEERHVNAKEYELNKLETSEQAPFKSDAGSEYPNVLSPTLSTPSADNEQQWPAPQPEEEDTLMAKYRLQIDEVAAREEKLVELKREKQTAIYKMEQSALFGLESSPEQELLDNYKDWEDELNADLEDSRATLVSIQGELENRKLYISPPPSSQSSETERASDATNKASSTQCDTDQIPAKVSSSENNKPELQSDKLPRRRRLRRRSMSDSALYKPRAYHSHEAALAAISGKNKRQSTVQQQFESLRDRISEWMFEGLTSSRLDRVQLQSQVNSASAFNGEDWWVMVRKHWHQDTGSDDGHGPPRSEQLRRAYSAYSDQ